MSSVIISGKSTYVDLEFVIEAQVTNCDPTLDYYFIWSVYSEIFEHSINVTNTIGSRLEIPPYSLKPGATYESSYQVVREGNKEVITEMKSYFQVRYRGLKLYLNEDRLMITVETAFTIEALVVNIDYYESNVNYEWKCFNNEEICNFIDSSNESVYNFSSGIPYKDEFRVSLTVTIFNESATANATIVTLDADLRVPALQIQPVNRIINENEQTTLLGKAYDVAPSCNLSWYFVTEELLKLNSDKDIMEYGEIISDSNRKLSLNEKFLGELIEFDYETKSIDVDGVITNAGKASLIADCECINGTDYRTIALVYAEVNFKLNRGPIVHNLTVFPESGIALETIFRIYSKAEDTESPLLYSFYCDIGNGTLLLASYFDHWTVDTFLPYVDGGTDIWVVVCDSLGACSSSDKKTIELHPNSNIRIDVVSKVMNDYIKRCETLQFERIAISAVVSYRNAGQSELTIFTKSVLESLPGLHPRCLSESRYLEVLSKLAAVGVNTTSIFK
ncbi:uncharacterized protein LOC125071116 [Vanessa atalanta]|uniref:uncharacterized protein LOC125071116 n=1 Tax=Vanessa atalanta TaxID=42275 RepID=UPI001FCDFC38|nr:uncharacterized protein LOC125071116 [Vanessa atalanta]